MVSVTTCDAVVGLALSVSIIATVVWVTVEEHRSAKARAALQAEVARRAGVRSAKDHAADAARHAAETVATATRARALVAEVERAFEDVTRIEREARASF